MCGQAQVEVGLAVEDAPDGAALGKPQPGPDAIVSRERVELGREEIGHAPALAGHLEVAGEVEQPLAALSRARRASRRSACSARTTASRAAPRAAAPRAAAAAIAASSSSGSLGREREVEGPELLVGDHGRELQVQLAALRAAGALPRRCSQERVRRAHAIPFDEQHPGVHAAFHRSRIRDRRQLLHAEVGLERQREQQPGAPGRDSCATRAPRRSSTASGTGTSSADRGQAVNGQRAAHLQREQRVPERRLEHAAQDVPGQAQSERSGEERGAWRRS